MLRPSFNTMNLENTVKNHELEKWDLKMAKAKIEVDNSEESMAALRDAVEVTEKESGTSHETFLFQESDAALSDHVAFLNSVDHTWYDDMRIPRTQCCEELKASIPGKLLIRLYNEMKKVDRNEYLAFDQHGNNLLMRMVDNLEGKHDRLCWIPFVYAYTQTDNAFKFNNKLEDVLSLSAMRCSDFPFISGFFASMFLQNGIDLNSRLYTPGQKTLIHTVIEMGDTHAEVLRGLLQLLRNDQVAVDPSAYNKFGQTPLYNAVITHGEQSFNPEGTRERKTMYEVIKVLMAHGSDPLKPHSRSGDTPLHLSLFVRDARLVEELLVGKGVEAADTANFRGWTPRQIVKHLRQTTSGFEVIQQIFNSLPQRNSLI